jgi:hypothetical protein
MNLADEHGTSMGRAWDEHGGRSSTSCRGGRTALAQHWAASSSRSDRLHEVTVGATQAG